MKKLIAIIFMAALFANAATANQTSPLNGTNWGPETCGVKMLIKTSTNIVAGGSEILLQCQVKNSTTNAIYALISGRNITAHVFLTSSSGKVYDVTPARKSIAPPPVTVPPSPTGYYYETINAGDIDNWEVHLRIGRELESGRYELEAQRDFVFTPGSAQIYKLESNFINIDVTNNADGS